MKKTPKKSAETITYTLLQSYLQELPNSNMVIYRPNVKLSLNTIASVLTTAILLNEYIENNKIDLTEFINNQDSNTLILDHYDDFVNIFNCVLDILTEHKDELLKIIKTDINMKYADNVKFASKPINNKWYIENLVLNISAVNKILG